MVLETHVHVEGESNLVLWTNGRCLDNINIEIKYQEPIKTRTRHHINEVLNNTEEENWLINSPKWEAQKIESHKIWYCSLSIRINYGFKIFYLILIQSKIFLLKVNFADTILVIRWGVIKPFPLSLWFASWVFHI